MERWRRPARVLAVELDGRDATASVIETSDGRLQVDPLLTVDHDTAERLRLGHMCANCLEPFQTAWPVLCPVCGMRVREQQLDYFSRQFRGVEVVRRRSADDELDAIREDIARKGEAL